MALLDKLTDVCHKKYKSCGPLSSFYMGGCKAVLFTWSTKAGTWRMGMLDTDASPKREDA
jgi:hypothetical protein